MKTETIESRRFNSHTGMSYTIVNILQQKLHSSTSPSHKELKEFSSVDGMMSSSQNIPAELFPSFQRRRAISSLRKDKAYLMHRNRCKAGLNIENGLERTGSNWSGCANMIFDNEKNSVDLIYENPNKKLVEQ